MTQTFVVRNAIVVTGTTDIIEATSAARQEWNKRHPARPMPEGFANHSLDYVWFTRPVAERPRVHLC